MGKCDDYLGLRDISVVLFSRTMLYWSMTSPSRGDDANGSGEYGFRRLLMELKQEGCRLLVTGDVSDAVRARRSQQLFGTAADRIRILASTDLGADDINSYLPDTCSIELPITEVIRLDDIRSVRVAETYSTPLHIDADNEFAAFRWRIVDAIARHRAEHTPNPAELRIGVATLAPLLDEHDFETIREFVRIVGEETVRSQGMVHFQAGLDGRSELASELLPLMDIHVELRESGGVPAHRWTLLDHNVHTQWIPLR